MSVCGDVPRDVLRYPSGFYLCPYRTPLSGRHGVSPSAGGRSVVRRNKSRPALRATARGHLRKEIGDRARSACSLSRWTRTLGHWAFPVTPASARAGWHGGTARLGPRLRCQPPCKSHISAHSIRRCGPSPELPTSPDPWGGAASREASQYNLNLMGCHPERLLPRSLWSGGLRLHGLANYVFLLGPGQKYS